MKKSKVYMVSRIVGLGSENAVWRLICLTCILIISSVQITIVSDSDLIAMIEKTSLFAVKSEKKRASKQLLWQKSLDYLTFIAYSFLPIALMLFIFLIAITKISLFGLLILVVGLILLWRTQSNFWRNSYTTIGPLALLAILLKVLFDFIDMIVFTGFNPVIGSKQKKVLSLVFGFQYMNQDMGRNELE